MEKQFMEKAYYIDDGIVLSGKYSKRKFIPDDDRCGFGTLLVTEDMFGKSVFFEKKLADTMSSEILCGKYEVTVSNRHGYNTTMTVDATSPKDAIDLVGEKLFESMSTIVFDWYDILEEYDTEFLEEYLKEHNIVACGLTHALYLSLVDVVHIEDKSSKQLKAGRIVASKTLYNPISYLEGMTGNCYIGNAVRNGYVVSDITRILAHNQLGSIKHFPLNSIERAQKAKKPVVLVDCSYYKGNEYVMEYHWFQITEDFFKNLA